MQKKILVLVSNPEGTSPLNLPLELKKLQEAVERSKQRDYFTVVLKFAATKTDLRRHILDERPQIIHFCGHASQQGLWLDNLGGKVELASNEFLTDLLKAFADRIECVVLNACDSENLANDLGQHLNYVIGMNREVRDDAAIGFAEAFYDALGAGETYERSFAVGRTAVLGMAASRGSDTRKAELLDQQGQAVAAQNSEHLIPVLKVNPNPKSIKSLWLSPEVERDAVRELLKAIESGFNTIRLFHTREEVVLADQYIPVQVTLERRYQHSVETIGGYAESEAELKRVYAMKGMGEEEIQRQQVDWQEARKQESRIVVLADPGMGKSTLLRREVGITIQQAYQALEQDRPLDETIVPFLIRLSTLADEIDVMTIEEAILKVMQERHSNLLKHHEKPEVMTFLNGFLKRQLLGGKGLLLLDALDEVPNEKRLKLLEKLNLFANDYPNCPIVGTSRIVGYGGRLVDGAKDMEIVPFSQRETEEYIRKWFKNAQDTIQDKQAKAQGLIQALRERPQLAGLAQNPLLLSLICSLFQHDCLTLPARRSQIYEQAVNCMLREWNQSRPNYDRDLTEAKIRLLEALAYHFTCEEQEVFNYEDLYDWVENYLEGNAPRDLRDAKTGKLIAELSEQDGILQKLYRDKQDDQYLFLHRTFQEYFTASYLKRSIKKEKKNPSYLTELVETYCWNYDWHETLTLLAGMMEEPMRLIDAIVAQKDDIFQTQLLLAGQCLAECGELSNAKVDEIIDRIFEFWLAYPGAEFILSVVVATGRTYYKGVERISKAIKHDDRNVRWNAIATLGKIGSGKAVDALISELKCEDRHTKQRIAAALGEAKTDQAVDALLSIIENENSEVRHSSINALGRIRNNKVVDVLISALKHEYTHVRWSAAASLGKIGSNKAVDALISALKHEKTHAGWGMAAALGDVNNNKTIDALIFMLNNGNSYFSWIIAEVLGRIDDEKATKALVFALEHENSEVRQSAAAALRGIENEKVVNILISSLKHEDSTVRMRAVGTLGRIGNSRATEALISVLKHKNSYVSDIAALELGRIGNEKAIEVLVSALKHEDKHARWSAAAALGQIGNSRVIEALISGLKHEDNGVRSRAAEALGRIGNEKAVEPLILAIDDEDSSVRRNAAEALGRIGNEKAVEPLILATDDEDSSVRRNAAEALERIGSPTCLKRSLQSLQPNIIHDSYIFPLMRSWIIRLSKVGSQYIPVYPETIGKSATDDSVEA